MNVHDSDWLTRSLTGLGFHAVEPGEALVYILNTCSVRERPEHKVYSAIGRLRPFLESNPEAFVAVGGCVAQQVGESLFKRFPEVRLIFGTDGIKGAPQAIVRLCAEPYLRLSLLDFSESYAERDLAFEAYGEDGVAPPPAGFVNIMQGCDNFCAYCIVPFVRGPQKSRQPEAVLDECRSLAERGVKEITLLGQNVNSYGKDLPSGGLEFSGLLRAVADIPGLVRLRFVTSHPKDIADDVIEAFAELECLCPRLHLPLQSGSDRILAAMSRKYTADRYLDVVRCLREARPGMQLSSDLIVGFPGETEADFEQTLAIMDEIGFVSAFSFCYSDRPGTAATRMLDKISDDIAGERLERLQAQQNKRSEQIFKSMVGVKHRVLLEGKSPRQGAHGATWQGRDPYGHIVHVVLPEEEAHIGDLPLVRIIEAKRHSFIGVPCEK
jgi:tRNA-2-methylthio-N6-dimethylallyladenosine synthase